LDSKLDNPKVVSDVSRTLNAISFEEEKKSFLERVGTLKICLFVLFAVVSAVSSWLYFSPKVVEPFNLYSSLQDLGKDAEDPCLDKGSCLMVFMKPPCKQCEKNMKPLLEGLQNFSTKYSADVGIMLVVGDSSEKAIGKLAEKLPGQIFMDFENEIAPMFEFEQTPAWVLWNSKRELQYHQEGVPSVKGSSDEQAQNFLLNYVMKRVEF